MNNVKQYRKKPVVIEAMQVTVNNHKEISQWLNIPINDRYFSWNSLKGQLLGVRIDTLEGTMFASVDDYIIKGVSGEFYPCKPDIFAKTYEEVKDNA